VQQQAQQRRQGAAAQHAQQRKGSTRAKGSKCGRAQRHGVGGCQQA
jgi:hypothetical protein